MVVGRWSQADGRWPSRHDDDDDDDDDDGGPLQFPQLRVRAASLWQNVHPRLAFRFLFIHAFLHMPADVFFTLTTLYDFLHPPPSSSRYQVTPPAPIFEPSVIQCLVSFSLFLYSLGLLPESFLFYLCLSVCLFVCLSFLSVCLTSVCDYSLYIIGLSVSLFLSVCVSVYLFLSVSLSLSLSLSEALSVSRSVCLSLSVCLSVCVCVCVSVCL